MSLGFLFICESISVLILKMDFKCPVCPKFYEESSHLAYHLKVHSNIPKAVTCYTCERSLKNVKALQAHLKRQHNESPMHPNILVSCSVPSCNVTCESNDLLKHLKDHIRDGSTVECPTIDCYSKYNTVGSLASHVSRAHSGLSNIDKFKKDLIVRSIYNPSEKIEETTHSVNRSHVVDEAISFDKEEVIRNIGVFYLRLEGQHHIPVSTIDIIASELENLSDINISHIKHSVEETLTKTEMSETEIDDVISHFRNKNILSAVHGPGGELRTPHIRREYFKNNFKYIEPVSIFIGIDKFNKKRYMSYIPIKKSLKLLVSIHYNKEFQSVLHYNNGDYYKDIQDGANYKNKVAKGYPIQLLIYQDEFEICNPLGSSKIKHKILAFYYTLVNIKKEIRTKVENLQLLILCKSTDIKEFSKEIVLKSLIEDLKDLESRGIEINGIEVPVVVHSILGDNLGSHFIGGFVQNFASSLYCCRYCLTTLPDFQNNLHSPTMRSSSSHESHVKLLAEVERSSSDHVCGVKENSCFNELSGYNVCDPGLPPCIAHDLLEGVVSHDMILFIKYFIGKGWFVIEDVNRAYQKFPFKRSDGNKRPNSCSTTKKNLGGTASENWMFILFFPIVMNNFIKCTEDLVWNALLLLRQICQYIFAPALGADQVAYLNAIIIDYLQERRNLFPDVKLRPKHHFMTHYAYLIKQFGPLSYYSTMRFEAKHQFFKKVIRFSPNFINVLNLLSEKHQLHQAFITTQITTSTIFYRNCSNLNIDLYSNIIQFEIKRTLTKKEISTAVVSDKVTYFGTIYQAGSFIITRVNEGALSFGKIVIVIITQNSCSPFFIVEEYSSMFEHGYGLHRLCPGSVFKCVPYLVLPIFSVLNLYENDRIIIPYIPFEAEF